MVWCICATCNQISVSFTVVVGEVWNAPQKFICSKLVVLFGKTMESLVCTSSLEEVGHWGWPGDFIAGSYFLFALYFLDVGAMWVVSFLLLVPFLLRLLPWLPVSWLNEFLNCKPQTKQTKLQLSFFSLQLPLLGHFITARATGSVTDNNCIVWSEGAQNDK